MCALHCVCVYEKGRMWVGRAVRLLFCFSFGYIKVYIIQTRS